MTAGDEPDLAALFDPGAEAEADIDLRGLDLIPALERLGHGLAHLRAGRVRVLIDPASPTSGETLFQPVARYLLEARRDGEVLAMRPMQVRDGQGLPLAGFLIELPPRHADTAGGDEPTRH